MAARLGILTNTLVNLVADNAYARVAKLILHLGLHHGTRLGRVINLGVLLTHQEIADMSGVNRQTVTRIVGDLRSQGVLSIVRRRIRIENEEALNKLIHEEMD
jgi:CRP/FNR family transcriptional regulator